MSPKNPDNPDIPPFEAYRLEPSALRWRCDPATWWFESTDEIDECPINIIGQPRAEDALSLGLAVRSEGFNIFVCGEVGSGRSTVVERKLAERGANGEPPGDVVFVHNFLDPDEPRRLTFPAGRGRAFAAAMQQMVAALARGLPQLFESEPYRLKRTERIEAIAEQQRAAFKEFEKRVQDQGFALVQVQLGPLVRPQLVPVVAGNAVEMDELETYVEKGKFKREEFDELRTKLGRLRLELEDVLKGARQMQHGLQKQLLDLNRELATPLIEDAVHELRGAFPAEGVVEYLDQVCSDIVEHLTSFTEEQQQQPGEDASPAITEQQRYKVNVLVDNAKAEGRPVIWETTPSFRNLFGTVEKTRGETGEWETDHTRIKSGSMLRANGGFLVLDAIDVLVEPGVWATLKRTLRHREVEIRSFDPMLMFAGASLKPESVPIDVKVVMIGTPQIYRLLHSIDEDFKKIFKIKAEFATDTPLNEPELRNFACLVRNNCEREHLPPFHRDAISAIVEHGVRLAGDQAKLTTRFGEITDLVREAGYWAREQGDDRVDEEHVDCALRHRAHRVDLIEQLLRERIAEGHVLIDLAGWKVGQVNGLAVLDAGDHQFALPSRITATTAMGRAGIIDIDRESEMSGSIHIKGVLILTGFLRQRFAQERPLTLTASLCFEQSYGGVEGDSASSAELYALLSSLADVPLRQGIAVTGSVNQRGEIQPIGGTNEKIEGFFDLCRLQGLDGTQGVMIPRRNQDQLMLRKDVVRAVEEGRFHVWAVGSVEEGLEVLAGRPAGTTTPDGRYPPDTIFGRADARLGRLAESVRRFGAADLGLER